MLSTRPQIRVSAVDWTYYRREKLLGENTLCKPWCGGTVDESGLAYLLTPRSVFETHGDDAASVIGSTTTSKASKPNLHNTIEGLRLFRWYCGAIQRG